MTSSLPDFSPSPAGAPANDAAALAALFPANGPEAGASDGAAPAFDTLMGASSGPAATAAQPVPGGVNLLEQSLSTFSAKVAVPVSTVELAAPAEATAGAPREITRDRLEEAAAFVTALLQSVLPGVQLPELTGLADGQAPSTTGATGRPAGGPTLLATAFAAGAGEETDSPAGEAPADAGPFTLAADGALELKLDLARLKPVELKLGTADGQPVTISAELQRSGEATLRLEAAGLTPNPDQSAVERTARQAGRAIIAAKYPGLKITAGPAEEPAERNFVFAGDKQVKSQSPVAGISVAKTETTMPAAPTEENRYTRNPEPISVLPQRAEFQVVASPAERITVPVDAPAGQNFAERAVNTVTSLAETQFSASMQKAGSVQLRLRFGGEDLNVRVEIRDGAVHTDFRTDSPELRSALAHEWQALAAQAPEQMRRFLEPVFSANAPAPASADTPSSFARQQQAQQDLPSRTPREPWAGQPSFSRRSQLGDSFSPEPAAARGPAFLPTSVRLSALA